MPESVATYCETKRITACHAVLDDILVSLYGDFSKYHTRMDVSRIRSVFASVIRQTGGKFVFAHASEGSMRSLDVFMGEHPRAKGMRTSSENFGQVGNVDIAPIYALGQIWRDGNATR